MQEDPYYDYKAVNTPDRLFGRKEILLAIFAACKQKQCFSLVGTRKIGKSSLLYLMQSPELQKDLGVYQDLKWHIFIYIEMRHYLEHTMDKFFNEIYEKILERANDDITLHPSGEKGHERFIRILQDFHQAGYSVVLIMDGFDKMKDQQQFGSAFFSFLRAPQNTEWISYITASLKPLYQISPSEAASPFFDTFKTGYIGALSEEDALQLISVPAERAGSPFSDDDIDYIRKLVGRHPFFIQVASDHLFKEKSKQQKAGLPIDYQRISQGIYEILAPHFDYIWNALSSGQQRELKQEGQQGSSIWPLDELKESALFKKHVRETQRLAGREYQIGQQTITVKDVKDALEKLHDRTFLQSSPLAELPSISKLNDGTKTPASKRGSLVQELLQQACERMKPGGTRTDTAMEWRSYNTLYYRYLIKGITNPQAAGRLGISLRQFYRDQERAIQALTQVLLDLDADSSNA
jgi:hypothetical protein